MSSLGVCVICPVYSKGDTMKTLASVDCLPVSVTTYLFEEYQEVRDHFRKTNDDWTLVLYNHEHLDSKFIDAIQVMMDDPDMDAYRFCCLIHTQDVPFIQQSIRMYRKGVYLAEKALEPEVAGKEVVLILDGWIFEHGTEKLVYSHNGFTESLQQFS